jgi:hypothetical protein
MVESWQIKRCRFSVILDEYTILILVHAMYLSTVENLYPLCTERESDALPEYPPIQSR